MDRNLVLIFALNLALGLNTQIIQPLFPLYLESLNASEVEIGLVITLSSLVATALMLPSGVLIDRMGKRKLFLISSIFAGIPPLFFTFVGDWKTLIPLSMIFNSSFAFFVPARMSLIAESAAPQKQSHPLWLNEHSLAHRGHNRPLG